VETRLHVRALHGIGNADSTKPRGIDAGGQDGGVGVRSTRRPTSLEYVVVEASELVSRADVVEKIRSTQPEEAPMSVEEQVALVVHSFGCRAEFSPEAETSVRVEEDRVYVDVPAMISEL